SIVKDLNKTIANDLLFDAAQASGIKMSLEAQELAAGQSNIRTIEGDPAGTSPERTRLNRYLVEDAFPAVFTPNLRLKDLPPAFVLDRNTLDPDQREELGLTPKTPPDTFNPRYADDLYTYLFQGLYLNLEATMFSILAFYIISAAYRAFRIRSAEAAILMITAVVLMLGQVPVGALLTAWIPPHGTWAALRIENISQWVLTAINAPVQRAIGFGLRLGQLAMALRIWLSLERGTYFGREE